MLMLWKECSLTEDIFLHILLLILKDGSGIRGSLYIVI
jgi:hypothetical protein